MKKETIELIEEYSRNFQNCNCHRTLLTKIISETSLTEKKAIIRYCEKEINKLHFYFLRKIILRFLLLSLCLILLQLFNITIPLICKYLFTPLIFLVLFEPQNPSFLREKMGVYDNLARLRDILLSDDYYHPFACYDCINYHGKIYNGNRLVCAIHPYGLKDCPDFEQSETR